MGALQSKPAPTAAGGSPSTPTSDTIIPFRYLDNQSFLKQFVLVFTYRFDAVLDPEKLRHALQRLLESGDWKQLGARVRKNASGDLEYHLSQSFDDQRPALSWSDIKLEQNLADHPLACRLPRAAPDQHRPQFFEDAAAFVPLIEAAETPRKIEDWTSTDAPLLSFHVVKFNDATLVTVSWCHAFMDGVGIASLMRAWTAMLAGQDDTVAPVLSFDKDPVELLGCKRETAPEDYLNHGRSLSGSSLFRFVVNQLWEVMWYAKPETRMICLPGSFIAKLKEQAARDETEFVSEGDVVSAWITRTTARALSIPHSMPVAMANVLDTRDLIGEDILPSNSAYIGNMCIQFFTYVSAGELASESLGTTALRIRKALQEQRTGDQFEAYLSAHKQATAAGRPPLFGPWNMEMVNISSWLKARFFEYDFSPAVVRSAADGDREQASLGGRPSYISATGHENVPIPSRNVGCLVGKDVDGNLWMNWTIRKSAWPAFVGIATGNLE
ncbi:uncharacterized protein LTR77_001049 [Saxophila tyrrhenica]|uniref:Uncharacterized protein n=1 Tax=Saxophila tyrrhenica TaxID=1690608 RepID=A0AAV9PJR5_9PEZI|nr:hypothetical protein LTR77_001049 [Saxophila tyrrhenica]